MKIGRLAGKKKFWAWTTPLWYHQAQKKKNRGIFQSSYQQEVQFGSNKKSELAIILRKKYKLKWDKKMGT